MPKAMSAEEFNAERRDHGPATKEWHDRIAEALEQREQLLLALRCVYKAANEGRPLDWMTINATLARCCEK